jgi:hypothetical protein
MEEKKSQIFSLPFHQVVQKRSFRSAEGAEASEAAQKMGHLSGDQPMTFTYTNT